MIKRLKFLLFIPIVCNAVIKDENYLKKGREVHEKATKHQESEIADLIKNIQENEELSLEEMKSLRRHIYTAHHYISQKICGERIKLVFDFYNDTEYKR